MNENTSVFGNHREAFEENTDLNRDSVRFAIDHVARSFIPPTQPHSDVPNTKSALDEPLKVVTSLNHVLPISGLMIWEQLKDVPNKEQVLMTFSVEQLNACDEYGRTVLHWAAYHADVKLVELLLKVGCSRDKCDYHARSNSRRVTIGCTPYQLAKQRRDNPQIIFQDDYELLINQYNQIMELLSVDYSRTNIKNATCDIASGSHSFIETPNINRKRRSSSQNLNSFFCKKLSELEFSNNEDKTTSNQKDSYDIKAENYVGS